MCLLVAVDFDSEIKSLRTTVKSVRDVSDLDRLERQIADLESQASAPDLWNDVEHAQQVTSQLSRVKAEHDRVTTMEARVDDLEALVELGVEESDAETLAEAATELAKLQKAVGELEVRTLLNGEYDEREAAES